MHKCTKFGLCEVDPNVLYHFNTVVTSLKSVTIEQVVKSVFLACSCKGFNDLNSFFAIVFGLMNGAISRLKHTWEVSNLYSYTYLVNFAILCVWLM